MRTYTDTQTSIVFRGRFNPAIFQPQWFAKTKLIKETEADAAEIEIVHRDATIFSTETFRMQVDPNSFIVFSKEAGLDEELRDLVLGTFKVLFHTPIHHFGVNWEGHYQVENDEVWHGIGHKLAPKKGIWDTILQSPGTDNLTIKGQRYDENTGSVNVRVAPSKQVHPGLYIHINDHFDLGQDVENSEPAAKVFSEAWENILDNRRRISEELLHLQP